MTGIKYDSKENLTLNLEIFNNINSVKFYIYLRAHKRTQGPIIKKSTSTSEHK
jgi:hypothetical protein